MQKIIAKLDLLIWIQKSLLQRHVVLSYWSLHRVMKRWYLKPLEQINSYKRSCSPLKMIVAICHHHNENVSVRCRVKCVLYVLLCSVCWHWISIRNWSSVEDINNLKVVLGYIGTAWRRAVSSRRAPQNCTRLTLSKLFKYWLLKKIIVFGDERKIADALWGHQNFRLLLHRPFLQFIKILKTFRRAQL